MIQSALRSFPAFMGNQNQSNPIPNPNTNANPNPNPIPQPSNNQFEGLDFARLANDPMVRQMMNNPDLMNQFMGGNSGSFNMPPQKT